MDGFFYIEATFFTCGVDGQLLGVLVKVFVGEDLILVIFFYAFIVVIDLFSVSLLICCLKIYKIMEADFSYFYINSLTSSGPVGKSTGSSSPLSKPSSTPSTEKTSSSSSKLPPSSSSSSSWLTCLGERSSSRGGTTFGRLGRAESNPNLREEGEKDLIKLFYLYKKSILFYAEKNEVLLILCSELK
jgi:hypothetical protein